jgi:hypothetical protein
MLAWALSSACNARCVCGLLPEVAISYQGRSFHAAALRKGQSNYHEKSLSCVTVLSKHPSMRAPCVVIMTSNVASVCTFPLTAALPHQPDNALCRLAAYARPDSVKAPHAHRTIWLALA